MNYFFTADEHYSHANVIEYCNRPFNNVAEMNETLIKNNNEIVTGEDIVLHLGDFCWDRNISHLTNRLSGRHIFLLGSHDRWASRNLRQIWEKRFNQVYIVACHYPLRSWARSHYGSIHLHGHSHGRLHINFNMLDVGVDTANFYPLSFEEVVKRIANNNKILNRESEEGYI